jgi:hypothetical protein
MLALVIGITAALGFTALGLGVFVLGQPARTPVMLGGLAAVQKRKPTLTSSPA